ncbi:MAG: cadmium-translocating P-type ATPase [Eubacterium sp.]|nr:cadmium-translocating P-type ATPase [Eubacterium sp.]
MSTKLKKTLYRVLVALALYAVLFICDILSLFENANPAIVFILFFIVYLISGYDVVYTAFRNIKNRQLFGESFLMMIATFGAFAIGEYSEGCAVMVFYQIGELFQSYAVGKSRESITEMMNIVPEYANLEENGEVTKVDPDDVEIGSIIIVKPGEKVPLDGIVLEGESFLDTAALTGESLPRRIVAGDSIISGCVNGEGTLKVKTEKEFDDSTVAKILELVENASSKKARTENFITKFAKYYTPVVTIGAVCLALIPPVILGGGFSVWADWIKRACIFLVISCPCALVISVPLGFFGGIGAASKIGVLVKGGNYLEIASALNTVVFDKTGTLTKGDFIVTDVVTNGEVSKEDVIEKAALGESFSNHPIALSILEKYDKDIDTSRIGEVKEIAGRGISAVIDQKNILLGNDKLMKENNIDIKALDFMGTQIHVASEGKYLGTIIISDEIKDGVKDALSSIKKAGIKNTVMLTGDHEKAAKDVAERIGIDKYFAELLPGEKVEHVENLLSSKSPNSYLAFVGDGINDAPVLARADVGIAMGSMGSDAAIEAADIVIMDDDISKIAQLIKISNKTLRIVKENIVFALGVKFAILLLGALGMANMWEAVFADVGVAVIAILNSMRTLSNK